MTITETVTFFKALSDPTRLKLIHMLRDSEALCVCDLTDALQQPQPTISRHLNHLRQAKILTCERRGTWVWYELDDTMPNWCKQTIANIEMDDSWLQELTKTDTITDETQKCC